MLRTILITAVACGVLGSVLGAVSNRVPGQTGRVFGWLSTTLILIGVAYLVLAVLWLAAAGVAL